MSDDPNLSAGDPPRLRGEDEAGAGSGRRDLAGLAIAIALFLLAFVIFRDAAGYPIRRSYAQFGPEIVPYIVATGVVIMALLTVVMALRGAFEARPSLHWPGLFWMLAAILLQIGLLYGGAGFILASTALFGCAATGFGQRALFRSFGIGLLLTFFLYLLFRYGLGLALPAGPLEGLIDTLFR